MVNDARANTTEWQTRLLCRRYLFLLLKPTPVSVRDQCVVHIRNAHWGLGVLADGQSELVGPWLLPTTETLNRRSVGDDLKARGVERIQFISGANQIVLESEIHLSSSSANVLRMGDRLNSRRRRIVAEANEVANDLNEHLTWRAARRGPFPDDAAAVAFMVMALSRSDSNLPAFGERSNAKPAHRVERPIPAIAGGTATARAPGSAR